MNLDLWGSYSAEQRQTFAAKIVQETRAHEMPLIQYRMIHWNSSVSDADIRILANWAHTSFGSAHGPSNSLIGEGDPLRGRPLFEKRCVGCHALTKNYEGPQLQGVYGRSSGSIVDYVYSPALKKAKIVWDQQSLDKWLTDPDALVPGTDMYFFVSRPQERLDLIAFLRQMSGK